MRNSNGTPDGSGGHRSRRYFLRTGVALGGGSTPGITTTSAQQRGGDTGGRFEMGRRPLSAPTVGDGPADVGRADDNRNAVHAVDGNDDSGLPGPAIRGAIAGRSSATSLLGRRHNETGEEE